MPVKTRFVAMLTFFAVIVAACGQGEVATTDAETSSASTGLRLIDVFEGAEIQEAPPEGLVILDVRTPEEFAEGHLEGAQMIDFYEADFAAQIADLDPDTPYLIYCRSGNRSGQTVAIMKDLGFSNVADVDGGITAWTAAGLPTVLTP